jgi:hypothetical protein
MHRLTLLVLLLVAAAGAAHAAAHEPDLTALPLGDGKPSSSAYGPPT